MKTDNQSASHDTVTLFVKVASKPGSRERAKNALLADVNGARTEVGNFKMELYQTDEDENVYYLFERWNNKADLEFHFKQPYTKGAFDLQHGDLTEPIEMNYLQDLWPLANERTKEIHRPLTTLIVPFEVKAGESEKFITVAEQFVPLVRKEPGNVEFHFHKVVGNESRFVLYERWRDQHSLDTHNQQSTTSSFIQKVTPLLEKPVLDFVLFVRDIS